VLPARYVVVGRHLACHIFVVVIVVVTRHPVCCQMFHSIIRRWPDLRSQQLETANVTSAWTRNVDKRLPKAGNCTGGTCVHTVASSLSSQVSGCECSLSHRCRCERENVCAHHCVADTVTCWLPRPDNHCALWSQRHPPKLGRVKTWCHVKVHAGVLLRWHHPSSESRCCCVAPRPRPRRHIASGERCKGELGQCQREPGR
jgi:hypothetical protein